MLVAARVSTPRLEGVQLIVTYFIIAVAYALSS